MGAGINSRRKNTQGSAGIHRLSDMGPGLPGSSNQTSEGDRKFSMDEAASGEVVTNKKKNDADMGLADLIEME